MFEPFINIQILAFFHIFTHQSFVIQLILLDFYVIDPSKETINFEKGK